MERKTNRRTAETKKKLRSGLLELLKSKKISQITISEICEESGLNRTTFYLHYQNQQALLDDIKNELIGKVLAYFSDNTDTKNTIDNIVGALRYVKSNKELFCILMRNRADDDFHKYFKENVKVYLLSRINIDQNNGLSDYIIDFYVEGCVAAVEKWLLTDCKESEEKLANVGEKICRKIFEVLDE